MTNYLFSLFFNCLLYFALHICYAGQKRVQFSVLNDCCRYLICHDVLSALEEETSETAVVYIEPNVGGIKVEDSADEGDGGLVDNLSGNQLNAVAEGVLRDGRSINN